MNQAELREAFDRIKTDDYDRMYTYGELKEIALQLHEEVGRQRGIVGAILKSALITGGGDTPDNPYSKLIPVLRDALL